MGHYEDFYYEINSELKQKGLVKEFEKQLKKMDTQDKHRYKDVRDRWSYAHTKVTTKDRNKNGK